MGLANIFRALRLLASSRDPSSCLEVIPFHFIGGWLHMYWAGLYQTALSPSLVGGLPHMAEIAGATLSVSSPTSARLLFSHPEIAPVSLECGLFLVICLARMIG